MFVDDPAAVGGGPRRFARRRAVSVPHQRRAVHAQRQRAACSNGSRARVALFVFNVEPDELAWEASATDALGPHPGAPVVLQAAAGTGCDEAPFRLLSRRSAGGSGVVRRHRSQERLQRRAKVKRAAGGSMKIDPQTSQTSADNWRLMKRYLAIAAIFLATSAFAQMKETVNVNVIEVPVTVVDSSGNPVRGLTAANSRSTTAGRSRPSRRSTRSTSASTETRRTRSRR